MRSVLAASMVAFVVSIFATPLAIKYLTRLKIGQEIRTEGPKHHASKAGTPTMGGIVFIIAVLVAYLVAQLLVINKPGRGFTVTALVILGLFVGMGVVGFIDDFIKVHRRRSLGLNARGKMLGQIVIATVFAIIALHFPNAHNSNVGSLNLSFVRDLSWAHIGTAGAAATFAFVVIATANGVNLTDGLDGLATGSCVMVLLSYTLIGIWQYRHTCGSAPTAYCYDVRDPLEVALIAAAGAGACFGFLWWNASPAKIFMGDTGALALGGLIGGLAMATRTTLLLAIIGLLFLIITLSVIIQLVFYRFTKKRVFRMAPLQHHFELAGWSEVNIVIRFWIISGLGVAAGLALFYFDYLGLL